MLDNWIFQDEPAETTFPIGAYTYRESRNSGTFSLGDNPQATRVFLVDWEYLAEFCDDLLGYSIQPESMAGNLSRVLPEEHPDFSYFFATDVTGGPKGYGSVSGYRSVWPVAELTVIYKPLPYGVWADYEIETELERFVSIETQSKSEFLTANNVGMQFVSRSENKAVQTSPGIPVPSVIQQYTWHKLPAPSSTDNSPLAEFKPPCLATYREMIGKTNATTFDGNPPQTMVLLDVSAQRLMPVLSDGLYLYDLIYTFDVRNHGEDDAVGDDEVAGVQYIYDLANLRWDKLTVTGEADGPTLFQEGEYNDLFTWSDGSE